MFRNVPGCSMFRLLSTTPRLTAIKICYCVGTNQKSRNTKLFKCLISIVCRGNDWFFFTVHVGAKKLSMNICKANIEVSFCRYFSCLKKDFMVKSVFAILTDGGIIQHNHGRNANVVQFVDLSIIFPSLSWLNQKKKSTHLILLQSYSIQI